MVYLEQEKNQIKKQLTFLISGSVATYIPERVKLACALKISESLSQYPNTMLQFTPDQILDSINKGWSVIALGAKLKAVGFAQLWQYGFNEDGQQILEFGSWLSFRKGWGTKIFKEAICLGKEINPAAQIVAIVEQENLKAQAILMKAGASEIGSKFSPAIKTVEGEAAFMKIFDITQVT